MATEARVLLGQGSATRGSSEYGLWVSADGTDVTTTGDANIIFSTVPINTSPGYKRKDNRSLIFHYAIKIARTNNNTSPDPYLVYSGPMLPSPEYFPTVYDVDGNKVHPFALRGEQNYNASVFSVNSHQHYQEYDFLPYDNVIHGTFISIEADGYNSTGGAYSSGTEYGKIWFTGSGGFTPNYSHNSRNSDLYVMLFADGFEKE